MRDRIVLTPADALTRRRVRRGPILRIRVGVRIPSADRWSLLG